MFRTVRSPRALLTTRTVVQRSFSHCGPRVRCTRSRLPVVNCANSSRGTRQPMTTTLTARLLARASRQFGGSPSGETNAPAPAAAAHLIDVRLELGEAIERPGVLFPVDDDGRSSPEPRNIAIGQRAVDRALRGIHHPARKAVTCDAVRDILGAALASEVGQLCVGQAR